MKKILLASLLFVSGSFFVLAAQGDVCSENGQIGSMNAQGVCVVGSPTGGVGNLGGASNSGAGGGTGTGASGANLNGLVSLIALAQTVVSRLVPFLIGLAVLSFFWFLIGFIWKGREDPKEQQKSVTGMGWSILALFVMVSVWGIIAFMGSVVGINQGGTMPGFKLPGQQ